MKEPRTHCCYCHSPIYDNVDERREVICGICVQRLVLAIENPFTEKRTHPVPIQQETEQITNVLRHGDKNLPLTWREANDVR